MVISEFQGQYRWLSNFWPWDKGKLLAPVLHLDYEGIVYPSVEHAYQAAKLTGWNERMLFSEPIPAGKIKRMGNLIVLRPNWEQIKLKVMLELVRLKFFNHANLTARLLATGDAELIEGNWWGDRYWGVCKGIGENHLGKILMQVRSEL